MSGYWPGSTYVVRQAATGLWIMDCFADECLDWAGGVGFPYAEFKTERQAKIAASRHRKWHRVKERIEYLEPCPHCGADGRYRKDLKAELAAVGEAS